MHSNPSLATGVSDLLQCSVDYKTKGTYNTALRSFKLFCSTHPDLPFMPTDALTIVGWLYWMCPARISPISCEKYLAGVRWAHICSGYNWSLSAHPLVKQALHALKRRYPELCTTAPKVPMTYSLMLALASSLHGWPNIDLLSYDDLLWTCASSIAFFASLRGGEFFTYPSSQRHVLLGNMVSFLRPLPSSPPVGVSLRVPFPKPKPYVLFEMAYAISPSDTCPLCPVKLLSAYRSRCTNNGLTVTGAAPCFRLSNGRPLNREFMVGRTEALMRRRHIVVRDEFGNTVPLRAASWRSGYVTSALQAGISELQIKSSGRWSSLGGVLPYSVNSTTALQRAAAAISATASSIPVSVIGLHSVETAYTASTQMEFPRAT